MKNTDVSICSIPFDDGLDKGGGAPPVATAPPDIPVSPPQKRQTYTRVYHFTAQEAERMICLLEDELAFLQKLRPVSSESDIEGDFFWPTQATSSDVLAEDWLPF